jgi:hypothetical protein
MLFHMTSGWKILVRLEPARTGYRQTNGTAPVHAAYSWERATRREGSLGNPVPARRPTKTSLGCLCQNRAIDQRQKAR